MPKKPGESGRLSVASEGLKAERVQTRQTGKGKPKGKRPKSIGSKTKPERSR